MAETWVNLNFITITVKSSGEYFFVLVSAARSSARHMKRENYRLGPRMCASEWDGRPFYIWGMESLQLTVEFRIYCAIMYDVQERVKLCCAGVQVWLSWLHCGLKDTGFRTRRGKRCITSNKRTEGQFGLPWLLFGEYSGLLIGFKKARTCGLPLASISCLGYEWVELYLPLPYALMACIERTLTFYLSLHAVCQRRTRTLYIRDTVSDK